MPIVGNGLERMGLLIANLRKLANVTDDAARIAAPEITAELQKEYAQGQDPYGAKWTPLRPMTIAMGRRPPPLDATGEMKKGTQAVAVPGQGIQLHVGHDPIGQYHQTGTTRMAARKVLPDVGMPKAWGKILREAAIAAVRKRVA